MCFGIFWDELPKISEFSSKLKIAWGIQITNYPVTPRFGEVTRSLLDHCGVSHVETTSTFSKLLFGLCFWFEMHDFYSASLLKKMGSSCLNPVI